MSTFTVNTAARKIASQALQEAEMLLVTKTISDDFIKSAISDLKETISKEKISSNLQERLKIIGRAAVRTYQSFDEVPAADRFVELCVDLSSTI